MTKKRVLALMSGGVDSSVSALLLKQRGYEVIGITLNIWPSNSDRSCCSISAFDDARNVAYKVGIPHYVIDAKEKFEKTVIHNFFEEYIKGRTPNPCIKCNEVIKFDYIMKKAVELECEYVATGHYIRKIFENGVYKILKGADKDKDQSYFLYILKPEILGNVLFPLGDITKNEVREIARQLNLSVHNKRESQDVCFVQNKDYPKFIIEHFNYQPVQGCIKDKSGKVIGYHPGIIYYTRGQRKKIGLSDKDPWYVVTIHRENDTIIVGKESDLYTEEALVDNLNFILPANNFSNIYAKVRYRGEEIPCEIYTLEEGKIKVKFEKPVKAITPGQAIVFYSKDVVLGGGVIDG